MTTHDALPAIPLTVFGPDDGTRMKVDTRNADRLWCLYLHSIPQNGQWVTVFVGLCRYSQVMVSPDARANSAWREMCHNASDVLLTIVATTSDQRQLHNMRHKMITENKPHCNMHGYRGRGATTVQCDQTGEKWSTVTAAAEHADCAISTMSNHLNRRRGYATIKGNTYSRI